MPYEKRRVSKTCGVCRAEFQGKSNQKYCSPACGQRRQKEQLAELTEYRSQCPYCGKTLPTKSGRRRKQVVNGQEAPPIPQGTEAVTTPGSEGQGMTAFVGPAGPNGPLKEGTPFKGPLDPDGSKQWYNRYGGLRGSEQPVPGKCGGRLWRTNPPRYCRRNPVKGKDKCRLHGGNAPIGIANGAYRDGRFSKHLPAGDLRNKYKRIVTNPDVISLRDDVALIQTRQALLLERLGDVSSPAWDEALAAYNASEKAKGRDRAAAMSRLGEVLRKGADADQVERQVWSELRKLIQEKTRTTAAEWKRVLDLSGVMTAQDALYFVESVLNTLRECIPDRQTLQRVQTRLLEYMPKEGK